MKKNEHLFKGPLEIKPPSFNDQVRAEDLFGAFQTVVTVPTAPPKGTLDQIQFYTDSLTAPSVFRLYIFSTDLNAWHYVALT